MQKLALIAGLALVSVLGGGWTTPILAQQSKLSASSDPSELWAFVKRLDARIKTDPQAKYFASKGQCLEWLGKLKQAGIEYSKAIKRAPSSRDYFIARARVLRRQNQLLAAEEDYTRAIELGDETVEGYGGRGMCRLGLKSYEGAIEDADRAIALGSTESEDWYVKGSSLYHLGKLDSALVYLNTALKMRPNDAGYLRARAQMLLKLGRTKESKADSERAHRLDGR
ncbi:MAG: tetratricopeptide repeat protein [Cyanobacteria bacterium HKST-UBA02]|nr:tetratricopeptide repeat protein [Cyanobacteria bacterium HKST-UBA02]